MVKTETTYVAEIDRKTSGKTLQHSHVARKQLCNGIVQQYNTCGQITSKELQKCKRCLGRKLQRVYNRKLFQCDYRKTYK